MLLRISPESARITRSGRIWWGPIWGHPGRSPRSGVQIRGCPAGRGGQIRDRPPSWVGAVLWVAGIWRGPDTGWLISGHLRLSVPLYILSRARVVGKRANWRCVTWPLHLFLSSELCATTPKSAVCVLHKTRKTPVLGVFQGRHPKYTLKYTYFKGCKKGVCSYHSL